MQLQLATLCTRTLGQFVAFSLTIDLMVLLRTILRSTWTKTTGMSRQTETTQDLKKWYWTVRDKMRLGIDINIPWMKGLLRSASGWKSNLAVEAMLNGAVIETSNYLKPF